MFQKLKEKFESLTPGEKIVGGIATGAAFIISAPLTIAAGAGYLARVYNEEKEKEKEKERNKNEITNETEDIKEINNNLINELNCVYTPMTLGNNKLNYDNIPSYYICPLSKNIMKVPVITPYGFSYEKDAIENWLINHNYDPITKKPLLKENLIINYALKNSIEEYLKQKQEKVYDINQNYNFND